MQTINRACYSQYRDQQCVQSNRKHCKEQFKTSLDDFIKILRNVMSVTNSSKSHLSCANFLEEHDSGSSGTSLVLAD